MGKADTTWLNYFSKAIHNQRSNKLWIKKYYWSIVKVNDLIIWLFNVFMEDPAGLTSILDNKMAVPFTWPSATALYCVPVPLLVWTVVSSPGSSIVGKTLFIHWEVIISSMLL